MYRSPSFCNNTFLACLNKILNNDRSFYDCTLIIGDMNINIIDNENVNNEYLDKLS